MRGLAAMALPPERVPRLSLRTVSYALKYNAIPLNASGKPAVEQLACSHWSAPDRLPPESTSSVRWPGERWQKWIYHEPIDYGRRSPRTDTP